MKYSKQRELIEEVVRKDNNHLTAEEIYSHLKGANPSLSLGTVYRNLNLLCESGIINRVSIPNSSDRYDAIMDNHQHVICSNCNKVFDINLPMTKDIEKYVNEKVDIRVNSVKIFVDGICSDCQKKSVIQ